MQFPHVFLAIGTTLGLLILTGETYYHPGVKMFKLRRGGKSLAVLLLALLAAALTAVLIMYLGGLHEKFTQTVNNLKPDKGERTGRFACFETPAASLRYS